MLRSLIVLGCCACFLFPSATLAIEEPPDFEVNFAVNSAQVEPGEVPAIAALADFLVAYPQVALTLAGYTDSAGSHKLNVRLSHDRAAAVRDLLVRDFGIAKERVGIAWLDSARPVADNSTASGRARNRRVGIGFISVGGNLRDTLAARMVTESARAPVVMRPAPESNSRIASTGPKGAAPRADSVRSPKVLRSVKLSYQEGSIQPDMNADTLADLSRDLQEQPGRILMVRGVTRGDSRELRLARRRMETLRARLIYGHKVPSSQLRAGWSGAESDTSVGVVLQLLGPN